MAHLLFQHRESADGAMGIAEQPTPSQRPCMDDDCRKSRPCRPAGCLAHQCSARQRWNADHRRTALRRWAAAEVETDLAAPAEWDGEEHQPVAPKSRPGSSRYRGVSWYERMHKWRVALCVGQDVFYLGSYADERIAAMHYNDEVMRRGLPAWRLNVIGEEDSDV